MERHLPKAKKNHLLLIICSLLAVGVSSCSGPIPTYTYKIVNSWPHDRAAFTEGLVFNNGSLYESNGQNGLSNLRIVDLETGNVKTNVDLAAEFFGEGLTVLNGKIFQLTWMNQKGFIYDQNGLAPLGEFSYEGQGWGLTQDGNSLIMSNGTNTITFLDPETFQVKKTIAVYDHDTALVNLNELEYVKGEIYANIWKTDMIVRIDPGSGKILGWIDLTGLRPDETTQNNEAVLNGIAYDPANDRLFVTGKLWPTLFEIKLEEKQGQ